LKIGEAGARFIIPPTNNNLAILNVIRKNVRYVTFEDGEKYEFDSHPYSQFNLPSQNEPNASNPNSNTSNAAGGADAKSAGKKQAGRQKSNTTSSGNNATNATNNKGQNSVRFAPNVGFASNAPGTAGSTHFATNWIECWQAKCAKIYLNYDYYPSPVLDWTRDSKYFFNSIKIKFISLV
jgi:hypothetical protein